MELARYLHSCVELPKKTLDLLDQELYPQFISGYDYGSRKTLEKIRRGNIEGAKNIIIDWLSYHHRYNIYQNDCKKLSNKVRNNLLSMIDKNNQIAEAFVNGISHKFESMLNGMSGFAEIKSNMEELIDIVNEMKKINFAEHIGVSNDKFEIMLEYINEEASKMLTKIKENEDRIKIVADNWVEYMKRE